MTAFACGRFAIALAAAGAAFGAAEPSGRQPAGAAPPETGAAARFRDHLEVVGSAADDAGEAARRSSLPASELRLLPAETLAEAMGELPGLVVYFASPFGGTPMVVTRGFFGGGEVDYLGLEVDGVPRAATETGVADWSAIRLDEVERIDLLSGPAMRRGGVDPALAGLLRITTKPADGTARGQASLALASFDTRSGGASWSGPAAEPGPSAGEWRPARDRRLPRKFRGPRRRRPDRARPRRRHRPPDGLLRLGPPPRTRGTGPAVGYRARGRPAGLESSFRGRPRRRRPVGGLRAFRRTVGRPALRGPRRRRRTQLAFPAHPAGRRKVRRPRPAPCRDPEPGGRRLDSRRDPARQPRRPAARGRLPPRGGGYPLRRPAERRVAGGGLGAPPAFRRRSRPRAAAGGPPRIRPSLRGDQIRDRSENHGAMDHEAWSPRLAVVWSVAGEERLGRGRGLQLFGELGRAFKAPTLDQLYDPRPFFGPDGEFNLSNPDLEPQRSRGGELGVRGHGPRTGWRLLAYRQMRLENEIDFDPATFRYANIGRSRHQGVEASWQVAAGAARHLPRHLRPLGSRATEGENPAGQLKNIPRDVLRLRLERPARRLRDRPPAVPARRPLGGRRPSLIRSTTCSRTDLRVSRQLGAVRLRADLLNLLDDGQPRACLPATGRRLSQGEVLHGFAPAPRAVPPWRGDIMVKIIKTKTGRGRNVLRLCGWRRFCCSARSAP